MEPLQLSFNLPSEYKDRLDAAWQSLDQDVKRWQKIVPSGTTIAHHINEFENFKNGAYDALVPHYREQLGAQRAVTSLEAQSQALDVDDFRALVIGVLTAHWSLLRQVASQRTKGSPYSEDLPKLDQLSVEYYHRARNALPETARPRVKASAPLIHLGNMSIITVFNQNVPLVLSIPYNSIDADDSGKLTQAAEKTRLAVPHEIGHAILIQVPELAQELRQLLISDEGKLGHLLAKEGKLTKRQEILAQTIAGWIDEILADMIGTALAGDEFAISAIWITATSENNVGIADEQHPPSIIRPCVHLKVLEYLQTREARARRAEQIDEFKGVTESGESLQEQYLAKTVGDRLRHQFKSIPALTFMRLEEVKDALNKTVDGLLDTETKLQSLEGGTLGDLLLNCSKKLDPATPADELYGWSTIPPDQIEQFALAMPSGADTDYFTPWMVSSGICDFLPWLPLCHK